MDALTGILCCDFETASEADLKAVGAWAYSLHPSTRVYVAVFGYWDRRTFTACEGRSVPAIDFIRWAPTLPLPSKVEDFIRAGGALLAHNDSFEKAIWQNVLQERFGVIATDVNQWQDTAAIGLALNLPPKLEGLAKAIGLPVQKDMEGAALMRAMAEAVVRDGDGWSYPLATPANLDRLAEYCRIDVAATIGAFSRMAKLTVTETLVHRLDQRINARGVYLDQAFAAKLARMAKQRERTLADEAFLLTDGVLCDSTSSPALKDWLHSYGVQLPKVARKKADGTMHSTETLGGVAVEQMLKRTDLPDVVRRVLANRREAGKTSSLAKLVRVESMVGVDGRLRNALQYCAAITGRWASYGVQLHNLPKNKLSLASFLLALKLVDLESLDLMQRCEERPLSVMSQLLRSVLAAAKGRELIGADFSAIEARVVAWLAGQSDKLEFLFDYDAARARGEKPQDLYQRAAEHIGSTDRQLGKVCELALGYGMGTLKLAERGAESGIALSLKEWRRVQVAWRKANSIIARFWIEAGDAARAAIDEPGSTVQLGRLRMKSSPECLGVQLPSGRVLRYWRPKIVTVTKRIETVNDEGEVEVREFEAQELRYFAPGKDKKTMAQESTYGGKLVENFTQAVSRDLLAAAMLRVDAVQPYEIVVHVHDSLAAEVPIGQGNVREFSELVTKLPAWADGLPVAADPYRDTRFRG